jgi:glutathione peroxidase
MRTGTPPAWVPEDAPDVYGFTVETIEGRPCPLETYRGRVLLIVNVASRCGFTPQYAGLERLYRAHRDRGFVVLAFPCNRFGGQEPGSGPEIVRFCEQEYGVTFPVFAKVDVNGARADPLFRYLTSRTRGWLGRRIAWNFTKFLVDRQGRVVRRYGPSVTPERLEEDVRTETAFPPR